MYFPFPSTSFLHLFFCCASEPCWCACVAHVKPAGESSCPNSAFPRWRSDLCPPHCCLYSLLTASSSRDLSALLSAPVLSFHPVFFLSVILCLLLSILLRFSPYCWHFMYSRFLFFDSFGAPVGSCYRVLTLRTCLYLVAMDRFAADQVIFDAQSINQSITQSKICGHRHRGN